MKIKFENGSEIKTIECSVKARPSNAKVAILWANEKELKKQQ